MASDPNQQRPAAGRPPEGADAGADAPASVSRRRFARGGAATASLIVTLASRPALADHCTVSGMLSGPGSGPTHSGTCHGLTPGYWKNHDDVFSYYYEPGPCNPLSGGTGSCSDYSIPTSQELDDAVTNGTITQAEKDAYLAEPSGTSFDSVFGGGLTTMPNLTLMQALWLEDVTPYGGPAPVLAHSAAALLNAHHFGDEQFGYTPFEIIALVQNGIPNDPIGLKDDLETLNTRG